MRQNNKQILCSIVFIFLNLSIVFAQSATVTTGGVATGSGGNITYTIGQIADQKIEGGDKYIIEGVQQPFEIQVVGISSHTSIILEAVLYPNPTSSKVVLSIRDYDIPSHGLTAQLYDFNGRIIKSFTIKDVFTEIDFSDYAAATYQLRILDDNTMLKTFKVVKKNM
jgi:hypothetical protein